MVGPVASTANIPTKITRFAASKIKEIQFFLTHIVKYYNWFAPMPLVNEGLTVVCHFVPGICKTVAQVFLPEVAVDNLDRYAMYAANLPSGAGYRNFVYYAQMINTGRMVLYDYGKIENERVYGTPEPPILPLVAKYSIPTAIYSGSIDPLADPVDVAQLEIDLGDNLILSK
jgi:hypothetical protein